MCSLPLEGFPWGMRTTSVLTGIFDNCVNENFLAGKKFFSDKCNSERKVEAKHERHP